VAYGTVRELPDNVFADQRIPACGAFTLRDPFRREPARRMYRRQK